jgi:cysteine desulfurase/selenocysteine lyase
MDSTVKHTHILADYFKEKIRSVNNISMVGNPKKSASIVSFLVDDIHPHDVASYLGNSHIAIRAGHHCAQPLMESMGIQSTARVSFSIYNTTEDVDKTINALIELKKFWA